MGLLLSAFLWAYAFSQLPGGALTDRLDPRRLLGLGLFVWSLAQAAAGLVGSFWQFVVARIFLGAGDSPYQGRAGPMARRGHARAARILAGERQASARRALMPV
jgi:MFS family permease